MRIAQSGCGAAAAGDGVAAKVGVCGCASTMAVGAVLAVSAGCAVADGAPLTVVGAAPIAPSRTPQPASVPARSTMMSKYLYMMIALSLCFDGCKSQVARRKILRPATCD